MGGCKAFLFQCSLVFSQRAVTYATDEAKIAYIIGLLRGRALAWATAVRGPQLLLHTTYVDFISEMKKVSDHPVQGKDAAKCLLSLRQGSRSVAEYSIDFRVL
ncbi:hypothetical protein LDENG_00025800, partial [Lucifuga dentata]